MKLLLDECLDVAFATISPVTMRTPLRSWGGLEQKNGRLLQLASAERFDALVTTDAPIEEQQNLATLPISVVILHAASNRLGDLLPVVPELLRVLTVLQPRTIVHVRP